MSLRTFGGFRYETITESVLTSSGSANTALQLCPATSILTISALTNSGSICSATTSSAHGYSTGQIVNILGATDTNFNGTYPVTVTSSTTFTYNSAAAPTSSYVSATASTFQVRQVEIFAPSTNTAPVTFGPNSNASARTLAAGAIYTITQLFVVPDLAGTKFDLATWYFKSTGTSQKLDLLWV